jgi:hypothetical protein
LEPGHTGAAVEAGSLELEDDAEDVEELALELDDEDELDDELAIELDDELAFELEDDELELALELDDEDELDELAFELEDDELELDEAGALEEVDVVTAGLEVAELELEALDDDVEVAVDVELDDDNVCAVMLVEFQMYISSLPGPPHISLMLPLQVMSHSRLPSTAGPPPFMRALPQ